MTHDTSATEPRPSFTPPASEPAPPAYGPPPTYGPSPAAAQPAPYQSAQPISPDLPPERVGRGAALALLAVPAGAAVAGIVGALGFIATLSGFVTAILAAVLYVRGSGGRVRKGIPLIVLVIALGVVASFFTVVAVELWQTFPAVDPEVAAGYPSRGSFVTQNLFYPPVLAESAKDLAMLVVFSVLGGVGTVVRLVRASRQH